jgi:hypothetical protein
MPREVSSVRLVGIALGLLQWVIMAFPLVMGILFGFVGVVFSMLALALLVGIYIVLREGVYSPYNVSRKYPRVEALLGEKKVDDFFGALGGAPAVFSIFGGLIIFAVRCLGWLITATWKSMTVQTVLGWPAASSEVATGLRGLDKIVWWFLADAPLELWLIVILPSIWFATASIPSAIAKRFLPRRHTVP